MTPTEAARHFSAVLGRVAAGEEIEVVRNGAPVAVIAPPRRSGSIQPVRDPLGSAPAPKVDDSFADDLRALRAELKAPPGRLGALVVPGIGGVPPRHGQCLAPDVSRRAVASAWHRTR